MEKPDEINSLLVDCSGTIIANVRMRLGDTVQLDGHCFALSTTGKGYNVYHELSGAPDKIEIAENGENSANSVLSG